MVNTVLIDGLWSQRPDISSKQASGKGPGMISGRCRLQYTMFVSQSMLTEGIGSARRCFSHPVVYTHNTGACPSGAKFTWKRIIHRLHITFVIWSSPSPPSPARHYALFCEIVFLDCVESSDLKQVWFYWVSCCCPVLSWPLSPI